MSRKIKKITFEFDGENGEVVKREVSVKELRVKQVKRIIFSATSKVKARKDENEKEKDKEDSQNEELLNDVIPEEDQTTIFDIFGKEFKELFELSISGIKWEELEELAPSEIEVLYKTFKEVNDVFFQVAQSLGVIEGVKAVLGSLKGNLLSEFASVFNSGIKTS